MRYAAILVAFILSSFWVIQGAWAGTALDRGLAAAEAGKWKIAIDSFTEAWEEQGLSPLVLYNLGLAHAQAGNAIPTIAWLEAYLAANPDAGNASQVRKTIAQLEVRVGSDIDALFKRADEIWNKIPKDRTFDERSGKWAEAYSIAIYHAEIGQMAEAYRAMARARTALKHAGGKVKPYINKKNLDERYVHGLARIGVIDDAIEKAGKLGGNALQSVATIIFGSFAKSKKHVVFSLQNGRAFSPRETGVAVRRLWLEGDVEGLEAIAAFIDAKGSDFLPVRVDLMHAFMGLGRLDLAKSVANRSKYKNIRENPTARYILGLLDDQRPSISMLNCYTRVTGRNALARMLETRHYALLGDVKNAKSSTWIELNNAKDRSHRVTPMMKALDAQSRAFEHYAAGNISKAKQVLIEGGQDVQSLLVVMLRNATGRDPLYAAVIAREMPMLYAGPFALEDEARRAEKAGRSAVARLLRIEAKRSAEEIGGHARMLSGNYDVKKWIDLALFYSEHNTLSGLSDVLTQLADGGDIPVEWMTGDPAFARQLHYGEYTCPKSWGKMPRSAGPAVSAPVHVPVHSYEWSGATDIARAAGYLAKALLQIKHARKNTAYE